MKGSVYLMEIKLNNIYGYGSDRNSCFSYTPKPVIEVGANVTKYYLTEKRSEEEIYTILINKIIESLEIVKNSPEKLKELMGIIPLELRETCDDYINARLRLFG